MSLTPDVRNRQGLAFLRSRYVRRAEFLCRQTDFHRIVERYRAQWNRTHPDAPLEAQKLLSVDEQLPSPGVGLRLSPGHFAPRGVQVDSDVWVAWQGDVLRPLSSHVFPIRDFLRLQDLDPTQSFVSACMIYHPVLLERRCEELIPELAIRPLAADMFPPSRWHMAYFVRAQGERDALREALEDLLADDLDRLQQILNDAREHGLQRERVYFRDAKQPWWYIPLIPGMSARDLERAATDIAERGVRVFDARPIDQRILELVATGQSRDSIAEQLGISVDLVRNAVKRAQQADKRHR